MLRLLLTLPAFPAMLLAAKPTSQAQVPVPLFDSSTVREPALQEHTAEALITRLADRARDRHAREAEFHAYDHYLTFYWEERTIAIQIEDRVAKGGKEIVFTYDTLTELGAPEFRAFYRGQNTVAEYHFNMLAPMVAPNRYSATLKWNEREKRELRMGDLIEVEISQFIKAPARGRKNYYGTTMLYVVGKGIVPWMGEGPRLDSVPVPESAMSGGGTTLPFQYSNEPQHRFKQMAANLAPVSAQPFLQGRRLHHTDFATGKHSEAGNPDFTEHAGKLGPAYVAQSCVACHVNNGRALAPEPGAAMYSSVVKLGTDTKGTPHAVLGSALQPQMIEGKAEGSVTIARWETVEGSYADGTRYTLRRPVYAWDGEGAPHFSVRLTPQLVGLGLLEAVSESTVAALADAQDADKDGISGRMQIVPDPVTQQPRLGRFGYKSGQASLRNQIAHALNSDMSVTTSVFPAPEGTDVTKSSRPELADPDLANLTRYIATLGVSAQRDFALPAVKQGAALFTAAGCAACHVPELKTGPHHPHAELRDQTIRPFTDLLLHDMGEGLADTLGEHAATGSEWRTAPLWSIGLTAGVSGGEAYLHDGRAASLEEAILWHGGEAEKAKEAFRKMSGEDRGALVAYLKSL